VPSPLTLWKASFTAILLTGLVTQFFGLPQLSIPLGQIIARFSSTPITASSARALSQAQERALKPKETFKECDVCPDMVVVPTGSFMMGSPPNELQRNKDEDPQHQVTFAQAFAVGKFSVTFDEWDACVWDGGCNGYRPADERWGRGQQPVINVSWDDAKSYVAWLSRKTGKTYRLLSEAEREYVTRAGTSTAFWSGSTISTEQANYDGNGSYGYGSKGQYRNRAVSVDSFRANPWGLYQVHGNVREWTEDCWNNNYNGAPTDGSPWTLGDCARRVLRGGSWVDYPANVRSALRNYAPVSSGRSAAVGFRVARTLLNVPEGDGSKKPQVAQDRALKPKDSFKGCDICPEMVVVPAGSFMMGSPASETQRNKEEGPQHQVTFAEAFAVGKYAVTFEEWDACVRDGGCNGYRPQDDGWGRAWQPVINVSWNDAKSYADWLSRKTGKPYRLLGEAEREYVTRAGTTTAFWSGATISTAQANYDGSVNGVGEYRKRPMRVDTFQPNPWGLYQVHGNVFEWTEDCWHPGYEWAPADGSAWTSGGDCNGRVLRGGSWLSYPSSLRTAARQMRPSVAKSNNIGFRVALSLPESPEPDNSQVASGVPAGAASVRSLTPDKERALKPKDSFKHCDICPEMMVVPAGTFTMGSPQNELKRCSDEGPQRQVTFARAFAVGKFALTFDEWDACVRDGGCNGYRPADGGIGRGRQPVINVSWNDAKSYVAWLSRKTGRSYRLLSEAEREYVTRAGTTTPFWWGSTISTEQANYDGNFLYGGGVKGEYRRRTVRVDMFPPNPWGLYQVHGNVQEWTEDCWHPNYYGAPTDGSAWIIGSNCAYRVVRGGQWMADPSFLRASFRTSSGSAERAGNTIGFRVALTLPESAQPDNSEKSQVATGVSAGAVQVRALTADKERALKPKDSFRECDACPEMVVVPAGSFMMGSPATEPPRYDDEGPQHQVTIARPFAVGKFSVTFDEWEGCVQDGGCNHYQPGDAGWGRGRQPVINVSWDDAKSYVAWLSRKTGKSYRLLSEAEREYVTRAGTTTPFWSGPTMTATQANYGGHRTVAVDSYQPNPWGLYQVLGNVSEWTEDCWHDNYNGAPTDGSAWTSGDCSSRALRGGSFTVGPAFGRAALRQQQGSTKRANNYIGFRVARTLPELLETDKSQKPQVTNVAPPRLGQVDVLTPDKERALKPKDSFKECDVCPEMLVVPAGSFMMGSPLNEPRRSNDEGPQHQVTFARSFAVGKFAVTFDEWGACIQDGGCNGYRPQDSGWGRGRRPVINISWDDAKSYVAWLSRKTGKTYRLLSEAEREYVTRAGSTSPFWSGLTISTEQANYNGNQTYDNGQRGGYRRQTVPVDTFQPNSWGLYQVHGNVYEWTEDCSHIDYNGAPSDGSAWTSGGDCRYRVYRGGSWTNAPVELRAAFRNRHFATERVGNYLGFRVARTLTENAESANATDNTKSTADRVIAYVERGNAYYNKQDYGRAIENFSEAIKLDPKYFQAYNYRGKTYSSRGENNYAITDFSQAIQLNPVYVDAYNNRGLAYKAVGRKAEAIADFRKAQSIDPSDQTSKAQLRNLGG
jgi:formylglycine-generating enzyme required for sulfatase activity